MQPKYQLTDPYAGATRYFDDTVKPRYVTPEERAPITAAALKGIKAVEESASLPALAAKYAYEQLPVEQRAMLETAGRMAGNVGQRIAQSEPVQAAGEVLGRVYPNAGKLTDYIGGSPADNPLFNIETGPVTSMIMPAAAFHGSNIEAMVNAAKEALASGKSTSEVKRLFNIEFPPGRLDLPLSEISDKEAKFNMFADVKAKEEAIQAQFRDHLKMYDDAQYLRYQMEKNKLSVGEAKDKFRLEFEREPHEHAGYEAKSTNLADIEGKAKALRPNTQKAIENLYTENGYTSTLGEQLEHPELFAVQPELKKILLKFDPSLGKDRLAAASLGKTIVFNPKYFTDSDWLRSSILHETGHETFRNFIEYPKGTSPTFEAKVIRSKRSPDRYYKLSPDQEGKIMYDRNANEQFQRVTEARAGKSQEELDANPIFDTWAQITGAPFKDMPLSYGIGPFDEGVPTSSNLNSAFDLWKKDAHAGKFGTYDTGEIERLTPDSVKDTLFSEKYWFKKPQLETKKTTLGKLFGNDLKELSRLLENTGYAKNTPVYLYKGNRYDIDPGSASEVVFYNIGKPADENLLKKETGHWDFDEIKPNPKAEGGSVHYAEGGPVNTDDDDYGQPFGDEIAKLYQGGLYRKGGEVHKYIVTSLTPVQKRLLKAHHAELGDESSFDDWMSDAGIPAIIHGHTTKSMDSFLTPEQREMLDQVNS